MLCQSKTKDIYITGGAGLIGSYLCEELNNKGYKVFAIDDFSKGQLVNLKNIEYDIEIIEADLQDLKQTKKHYPKQKIYFILLVELMVLGIHQKII